MSSLTVLRRMLRYLRPYWGWAIIALIGVLSSTALSIAIPTLLRDVIDIGVSRGDSSYMLAAGGLVIGLGVLRGIAGFVYRYFGERMSHFIAFDLRNEIYDKVQNQSFTYHDTSQTGTLITRAISDVAEMQRFFAYGLIDGLNTLLLIVFAGAIMLATSPALALLAMIPLIPLAFFSRGFANAVDPAWRKIMDRLQTLGNYIQETALGAEVVRAFAREQYEIQKFARENQELYYDQIKLVTKWGTYIPLSTFIIAFSTALVLFFGGWMEQTGFGGVTVGIVVAFNAYVLLLAMPIRFLGFVILLVTQGLSSGRRVFEIMDAEEKVTTRSNARPMPELRGHVQFKNVSFTHEGATKPTLRSIDLEARPGEIIGLIGQTGSGKSTLVNLIPRFYDVSDGCVSIDGVDVRDMPLSDLRQHIGFVLQQSLLFSATVRENIAYGNPDATNEQIIAAAKAANVHPFISEFPEGYDTLIGERGVTLSGGQKQRVAIARALLINPRILILDDSTSSVDTRTERHIQQALETIMQGRTTFIIAQRISSVQKANQILVLKDGAIIERGKHDELLAINGHYAEIYRLQLADQERVRQELADFSKLRVPIEIDKRSTDEYRRAIADEATGD
ncbi:MAG: ABC transporter ATP-binding protein [Chloroflexi bacterium]|nr:ABC transporter ATP-binding protein [Chloroflexota bacterium]